jgi:hypothetical protein
VSRHDFGRHGCASKALVGEDVANDVLDIAGALAGRQQAAKPLPEQPFQLDRRQPGIAGELDGLDGMHGDQAEDDLDSAGDLRRQHPHVLESAEVDEMRHGRPDVVERQRLSRSYVDERAELLGRFRALFNLQPHGRDGLAEVLLDLGLRARRRRRDRENAQQGRERPEAPHQKT